MSNIKNLTRVSGRQVGRNAKKVFGCEMCNFMMEQSVNNLHHKNDPESNPKLKTGSDCPRCGAPTIRLFDSIAEHTRACELKLLRDAGEIEDLEFQPRFDLHVPEFETGEPKKIGTYVADFCYFEVQKKSHNTQQLDFIVEDVKNKSMVTTDISVWKMKHYEAEYGQEITIVGR